MKSKHTYILLLITSMILCNRLSAENVKETYVKFMENLFLQPKYALQYNAYLVTKEGVEKPVVEANSVVVRNDLSFYTNISTSEYLLNTEGSIVVDNVLKKITLNYKPYTQEEKSILEKQTPQLISNGLVKAVNNCDSVLVSKINDYTIYTTFSANSAYTRAECWINTKGEIAEVRYYYKESDFLYYRIKYNEIAVDNYIKMTDFSYFVQLNGDTYVPTAKYKDYEIIVGN